MHITVVISSMGRGGAERLVAVLANQWVQENKEITLLTFDQGGASAYPIRAEVKRRSLGLDAPSHNWIQAILRNLKRIIVIRRAIRESQPDIVISCMNQTNVLTLLATRWLNLPVIIEEQTDPAFYDIGPIWPFLRSLVYPLANSLVCPSAGLLSRIESTAKVRGRVIPNPIDLPNDLPYRSKQQHDRRSKYVLMAMGRLVHEKGFDLLLNAFARIASRHREWSLTILGGGPLREQLEAQAAEVGLAERVHFTGELADPFPLLCTADLFVFSSRFEGFGMALAEAMACGAPGVSFDCPYGPREIIRHEVDGLLVSPEDIDAMAAALDYLMGDAHERQRLAAHAPEVLERFGCRRILRDWQELFDKLLPN